MEEAPAAVDNYPNPFNPTTTIPYSVLIPGDVRVSVYNALGQQVRELANGPHLVGRHTAIWDGRGAHGHPLASGVYIYRIAIEGSRPISRKMVLLR